MSGDHAPAVLVTGAGVGIGYALAHSFALAGAQVGSDLRAFAPADAAKALWPRPILVIHGLADEMVRFERGEALFDAAYQPKYEYWIEHAGHEETLKSDHAARLVKRYFDAAARIIC